MPQIGYSTIADHFFYPEQRIVFNQIEYNVFFLGFSF